MPKIRLHHLRLSRSIRVIWLLEELGLEYELETYTRDENFRAPKQLEAIHPLGRAPILELDGKVIAESAVVLEALNDLAGYLRPEPGTEAFDRYRFFLHYAEGSLMPPLLVQLIFDRLRDAPWPIKPIAKGIASKVDEAYTKPQLELQLRFVDAAVEEMPFFCGDAFTAADIHMHYAAAAGLERGGVRGLPHLGAWRRRVESRPAYAKAVERGGPPFPTSSVKR